MQPLGALADATLRFWRLDSGDWRLVTGPHEGDVPRAPRSPGQDAAAFVAVPESGGLFLEVVPHHGGGAETLATRLLPIVQAMIEADATTASVTNELATRYEEIDLLYSIGELLGHARALEEVAQVILRGVTRVIGARRAGLRVYDQERGVLRSVGLLGTGGSVAEEVPIDAPDEVVVARAFRSGQIETGEQPGWVPGQVLAVPIVHAVSGQPVRVIGTLALADRAGGGAFTRDETKLVSAVASQIGAAIENARLSLREQERQRLASELKLAHDLQVKLMPTPAVLKGDAEVAVHSIPAESLGGDFYTFARLGRGRVGVMLGDVSSHGFAAALIAAQVMAAAGIHANANTTPDETLALLRDSLADELANTEMYLSIFYAVLDPTAGRLTYSSAGHPYAYRVPRLDPPERLMPTAAPMGLVEGGAFGRKAVPWRFSQDLLVLFTDGILDQALESGERYGEERLLERLSSGRALSPDAMVRHVLEDIAAFGAHAADDCTLLVLRA